MCKGMKNELRNTNFIRWASPIADILRPIRGCGPVGTIATHKIHISHFTFQFSHFTFHISDFFTSVYFRHLYSKSESWHKREGYADKVV